MVGINEHFVIYTIRKVDDINISDWGYGLFEVVVGNDVELDIVSNPLNVLAQIFSRNMWHRRPSFNQVSLKIPDVIYSCNCMDVTLK